MKKIVKLLGIVLAFFILAFILLLAYLMLTEYRPKDVEELALVGKSDKEVSLDDDIKIMSWNIGYAGLDKDTDFFMDGGEMVFPISKGHVENSLESITKEISKINPDIKLLQEIDSDSKRTWGINQVSYFDQRLEGNSNFAYNYKVNFVPFPIPPLGKVNSGIYTSSKFSIEKAYRYQQAIPHKWPIKLANLKRAFSASYLPIENSDKNLVVVNAHLDAYESGSSGRLAQTKQIIAFMIEEYNKGNYVVVGGDFNQELRENFKADIPDKLRNPSPFPYDYLTDDFKVVIDDKNTTSRLNHKPYDPNDSYECIIDGFIVSKNIEIKSIKTQNLGFKASDHNPVLIEISLKKEPDQE